MNVERKDILKEKSFHFAIRVANLCLFLNNEKKEFVLSKQLLRSGTAVGALIRESKNAESKADFIHKLGIAQKECDETLYWLELLEGIKLINKIEYDSMSTDATGLLKMIRSSIITAKKNLYS
jgi:four helix bundle protein